MRILIAGLGGVGQRHVRNIRTLLGDKVDLIAWRVRRLSHVVSLNLHSDGDRNVEEVYGIRVFDDLDKALAERPDAAFICNPTSLHVSSALACLRAGCDLFLEKPVSHSLDGVEELCTEASARQRVVMVGYQLRFHPCFLALQKALRDGALGNRLAVRAHVGEYLPAWHPYEDYRQMYASRAELGGGVLVTQIHEFDYLFALFGMPKRLFSVGGHWSHLEINVEDTASTLMEYQIEGRPFPVHLQQDYLQRPPSRGCEVIGDRGKAVIDFPGLSVTRYDADGKVAETERWENFERNQLFLDELGHFFHCMDTRQRPVVDLVDGLCSLRMALAARESTRTGRIVELNSAAEGLGGIDG